MNHLYESLPTFAQNLACTWAGYVRARDRFSRHFYRRLREWQQTEKAPLEGLLSYQRGRLDAMVRHAQKTVPVIAI